MQPPILPSPHFQWVVNFKMLCHANQPALRKDASFYPSGQPFSHPGPNSITPFTTQSQAIPSWPIHVFKITIYQLIYIYLRACIGASGLSLRCFLFLLPNYIHVYAITMEYFFIICLQEGSIATPNTPFSSLPVGSKYQDVMPC